MAATAEPWGVRPARLTPGKLGIYAFLVISALFFAIPLYVMVVTSLKTMPEIRLGSIFAPPSDLTLEPWSKAWASACTGLNCNGI